LYSFSIGYILSFLMIKQEKHGMLKVQATKIYLSLHPIKNWHKNKNY